MVRLGWTLGFACHLYLACSPWGGDEIFDSHATREPIGQGTSCECVACFRPQCPLKHIARNATSSCAVR